jgi:hypothetical protein
MIQQTEQTQQKQSRVAEEMYKVVSCVSQMVTIHIIDHGTEIIKKSVRISAVSPYRFINIFEGPRFSPILFIGTGTAITKIILDSTGETIYEHLFDFPATAKAWKWGTFFTNRLREDKFLTSEYNDKVL